MSIPDHRVGKCIQKAIKCACAPNLNHQNQITPRSLHYGTFFEDVKQKSIHFKEFLGHCFAKQGKIKDCMYKISYSLSKFCS